MPQARPFTEEEDNFLKANFVTLNTYQIGKQLNRRSSTIRNRYTRIGLKLPSEIAEKFRTHSHFKKGSVPVTKGMKQTDYMDEETIARTVATRFKKGQSSHTELYDGAITERIETSTGRVFRWIRLGVNNWRQLHAHVWEQTHGPIPKSFCVRFRDGNTLNCVIENLELVSRQVQMASTRVIRINKIISRKVLKENLKLGKEVLKQTKAQERAIAQQWKDIERETNLAERKKIEKIRQEERIRFNEQKRLQKMQKQKLQQRKITSVVRYASYTARRQEDKRIASRQLDFSQMVCLRIDNKTIIYIKPTQDPEEEKAKYLQNRILATQGNPYYKA